ncbi:hypothetical protein EI94DRAFT_813201 [Lactarius quietus]|nr:hypothetical protein EI94DRAFT_813201 [Lactarius quietus]
MSIVPGASYQFVNRMAGLALQISADDQESIIGEVVKDLTTQQWTPERVDGGYLFRSKENGKYIGINSTEFEPPMAGTKLILVDKGDAKVWTIQPDMPPNYRYDVPVLSSYLRLSSISFDRIGLRGFPVPFLIEFPLSNLNPGTYAQLGLEFAPGPKDNKVWMLQLGELFSRVVTCYTLTHSSSIRRLGR